MKLLIIDNYDSFTFNLKHICELFVDHVDVIRLSCVEISKIDQYDKIILSPGPGLPSEYLIKIVNTFYQKKSILGVCLGAQAIAQAMGCELYNMKKVMHGKESHVSIINNHKIYKSLDQNITVGRYHSWAIDLSNNQDLIPTALDENNIVMSFRHVYYSLCGIQYHPESILTNFGQLILQNWLID
tara:strand:- start:357 stop:911 length:555 start_codon:yes stop_codon:yes gene_type:complete